MLGYVEAELTEDETHVAFMIPCEVVDLALTMAGKSMVEAAFLSGDKTTLWVNVKDFFQKVLN